MRCDVYEYTYTTQLNVDRLEDAHTSTNDHVKFHGNLGTQMKNQLMVKKFSIFLVENLVPMHTAREYTFNTLYNTDTHTLLDTTDIVGQGSIAIFRNGVKTEVNSPQFPLLTHNSILSDQDGRSPGKFCDESMFSTLSPLSGNASNCRESDTMEITPLATSFSMVGVQRRFE
jgi:hypothetical protein